MITNNQLKELLNYNQHTGIFTWKVQNKRTRVDSIAGCYDNYNYIIIRIDGKNYKAHRLSWLYIYNEWPKGKIDHINGNPADNRITNLREVTVRENSQNRKEHRNGKLVGCHYNKKINKWISRIQLNKKRIHLGYYDTQQEAHNAYIQKIKQLKENTYE
jgi:hypothetical protein